jgi:hypothetical protein
MLKKPASVLKVKAQAKAESKKGLTVAQPQP